MPSFQALSCNELKNLIIALEDLAVEEIPSVLQFQWREDFWYPGKLSSCSKTDRNQLMEDLAEWANEYNEYITLSFDVDKVKAEAEAFFPKGRVLRCTEGKSGYYAWTNIISYIFIDDHYRIQFEVAYDD